MKQTPWRPSKNWNSEKLQNLGPFNAMLQCSASECLGQIGNLWQLFTLTIRTTRTCFKMTASSEVWSQEVNVELLQTALSVARLQLVQTNKAM